jgi:peptide/nickel transport system substrate-binding protein
MTARTALALLVALALGLGWASPGGAERGADERSGADDRSGADGSAAGTTAAGRSEPEQRPALVIGVVALPNGLDPAVDINIGANGFRTLYSVFDRLIFRDFLAGGLRPGLAESWRWESETELVLELRRGVTFHDGSAFTAEDVVFSLERVLEPGSDLVTARGTFANVAAVEALGDHTVKITTKGPDPVLEQVLTMQEASIVPAEAYAAGAAEFNRRPVGTGPYRVASFVAGDRLVLEPYDGYWGGTPTAGEVVFRVIPETAARVTALVTGEIDIAASLPPDQAAVLERFDGVEVRPAVLDNIHVLRYNTTHPVLRDVRLRRAMNLAIDRQLLSDSLWGGVAVVPRGHQFASFGDMYDASRPVAEFDPERARALVKESGYAGEKVYLNAHPTWYTNGLAAAEAIVEMWRSVGIDAEVRVVPGPEELFGLPHDDPFAMVNMWSNSMRFADPAGGLWATWNPNAPPQASGYWRAPDEFNALGLEARSITDRDRRRRDYWRMLDIWEEEAPGTVLYYSVEFYGVREGVEWRPYSDFYIDLRPYNLAFR